MSEGAYRGQTKVTEVRRRSQRSSQSLDGPHRGKTEVKELTEVRRILQIQRELVEVRLSSQRSDGGHRG